MTDSMESAIDKAANDFRSGLAASLLIDQNEEVPVKEVALSLNLGAQEYDFDRHDRYPYEDGTEILAQVADEYMLSPEAIKEVLKLAESRFV